jgi:carboxypeptidase family protein
MKQPNMLGRLTGAVVVFVALLATVSAQAEMGRITGSVLNAEGAGIADALVVARSPQTGLTRKTKSSKAGSYTIPNLKAGVYEVTVEAEQMDSAMLQVRVTVGSSSRLDFKLYPSS